MYNNVKGRCFWPEVLGMCFYYCNGIYFYAWNHKQARKKYPTGCLYVVNDYGNKIECVE